MATIGLLPAIAIPVASVTACCSAIATSKYCSGYSLEKRTMPEPSRIAGVIAISLGSCAAISHRKSPKIFEKVGLPPLLFGRQSCVGSNFGTP